MDIEKFISPLIASQFPSFYREEGSNFIAFVKAYYEWLEESNNPTYHSRRILEYTDIDTTAEEFIKYFKKTYIDTLPENVVVDKRLLIKHILDLYRSKGSQRSYELLFRILFNEDIELYFPGNYLFSSSEAKWITPRYIEVSSSEFLTDLINKEIYSSSGKAVVENYSIQKISNKIINSLELSNLRGNFKFGEKIYCDDLYINTKTGKKINYYEYTQLPIDRVDEYQLALNLDNAPVIFGSLSSVSILNGGANYNVGDTVNILGTGKRAQAKVLSTANQNGLVEFTLIDGGFGFTTNAVVTITGGGGTGATFKVGDITNRQVYRISKDTISPYVNTQLDIDALGFTLEVDNVSGTFNINDNVQSTANVVEFDVTPNKGVVYPGSILSNTTYGISGLYTYFSSESLIAVTGAENDILNANLVTFMLLNDAGGNNVFINTKLPKKTITANATVVSANSTAIVVDTANGYFIPSATLTDVTSSATANIVNTIRNTNWNFPKYIFNSNLDTPSIEDMLTVEDLQVGTITFLSSINPGSGYSSNPTVQIVEPEIYGLRIPDGKGGFYGFNSVVYSQSGIAKGVVTSVSVIDSGYGYKPDETLLLNNPNNQISITGTAIIDTNGIREGYWQDNKSFSSDKLYLQDSDYYQTYAYEIVVNRMLETYEKAVKDLIHPSGFKLFGKYKSYAEVTSDTSLAISYGVQQG